MRIKGWHLLPAAFILNTLIQRDENEVATKDIMKARALSTWSLDKSKIKDQKELISDCGLVIEEQVIASLYHLMQPRRSEYATMTLSDETDTSILETLWGLENLKTPLKSQSLSRRTPGGK